MVYFTNSLYRAPGTTSSNLRRHLRWMAKVDVADDGSLTPTRASSPTSPRTAVARDNRSDLQGGDSFLRLLLLPLTPHPAPPHPRGPLSLPRFRPRVPSARAASEPVNGPGRLLSCEGASDGSDPLLVVAGLRRLPRPEPGQWLALRGRARPAGALARGVLPRSRRSCSVTPPRCWSRWAGVGPHGSAAPPKAGLVRRGGLVCGFGVSGGC
ncbi:hypothetical protein GCM10017559_64530 [Streptosporangium longisporum]|uniref:Uncharacterized protein n=1 Tax=Streptosporangium longisporum TaxID=46187 RepID=A0ABP6L0X5_9ACTN